MSALYVPEFEARAGDVLEDLAARANQGEDVASQLWQAVSPVWMSDPDGLELAWADLREAVSYRDLVAGGLCDWREILGPDAASTWEQSVDLLCQRADEALMILRLGRRGGN